MMRRQRAIMNDSSSGGLRRTTVNVKHRSTRLSSSFKEDINVEQQQQQRSGFLTRNLIRMFKSGGGRSHTSFSDDDEPTNNGKKRTGNTDKLSRKFLNMILTTANRSSNNKCSKSATDDLKIPISKTHSFKPIQVNRYIHSLFMIYYYHLIFGLFFRLIFDVVMLMRIIVNRI